ncbi:MAG: HEPN domain-containing protein [Parcubacteria group bacterium]
MKKSDQDALALEWFERADTDIELAISLLRRKEFPTATAFHAQQGAEKYLKGLLVWHGKDIKDQFKIHSLARLFKFALALDRRLSEEARIAAVSLDRYYVDTRYPGDVEEYTRADVASAVAAAEIIRDDILKLTTAQ